MKSIKKVYSKEFWILVGVGFLPLLWKILEIAFLSSYENALKVFSQIVLIGIIFKVFEETLLNPLYKILGKLNSDEQAKNLAAKKFLVGYSIATIIFTLIVFLLNDWILKLSKVPEYILSETSTFFKIYIPATGIGVISKYLYTFSLISKNTKKMFVYLIIKAIVTAILFVVLIPNFTLGLGVNGIAIAELVVNVISIIYLACGLKKGNSKHKINAFEYFKLALISFLETLVRNVVYYCVILVFLNMIDNQDLYFISNEFIWSILLVPCLSQAALIRQDIATNNNFKISPYFKNCIVLSLFMTSLVPISPLIFKWIYNLPNYMDYFFVLLKLFPCYLVFVFDSVVEAYFSATGKLHHILIQTILTNVLVYLSAFILYLLGVWTITLNAIIILFNLGMIISSTYTIIIYLIGIRKNKKYQS